MSVVPTPNQQSKDLSHLKLISSENTTTPNNPGLFTGNVGVQGRWTPIRFSLLPFGYL